MDPRLVREFVNKKKKTFLFTILLLFLLSGEFYYLNCYMIYVYPFCELTWAYLAIALIVGNFCWYFSGSGKSKTSTKQNISKKEEKP
ncbi:hypothetical protein KAR91_78325 [Candidatus Pacearchaeota archaeon]|nr:hypothetical protein [Candidatus Pacearchaeota archaeon]